MTKKELTTITIKREIEPMTTEQWDLMPVGTTFIHPEDKHLCLKVSDKIMFDFTTKETFELSDTLTDDMIWDFGREEPIEFELVDISITIIEK